MLFSNFNDFPDSVLFRIVEKIEDVNGLRNVWYNIYEKRNIYLYEFYLVFFTL